jgi:outer membrane protein assembly factor BamB
MSVKRNHGLTRTVPTVAGGRVVAMGPKCHVVSLDAVTGAFGWGIDTVKAYGAVVPPWYTGQCPLVDGDAVILAPGGPDVLMVSVEAATGKERWRSPNPRGWKMTHASIVPMDLGGRRLYLYPASGGVVAVDAKDGAIVWETAKWKINIATVPSPVLLGEGRVFFTGGYSAGSALFRFRDEGGKVEAEEVFRVKAAVFGATQHTPVWYNGHLYGIRADGRLVCLSADGKVVWASGPDTNFGLGPVMIADGLLLAMDDAARLTLAEAVPDGYRPRVTAAVLEEGVEAWAPLALAGNRLLARDLTRMVCLAVGQGP